MTGGSLEEQAALAAGAICVVILWILAATGVLSLLAWSCAPVLRRVAALACALWWRMVPLTLPGRLHERHVRRQLGMGSRHPEHVTRPPSGRHKRLLDTLEAELWPDGEWTDHIRDAWREGQ